MNTSKWQVVTMCTRVLITVAFLGSMTVVPAHARNQFKDDCIAKGGTYHGPIVVCTNPGADFCACGCDDATTRHTTCGGCFAPDTPIQMADGSFREVEDIKVGDMIWNPVTRSGTPLKNLVIGPEPIPLIEFGYEGNTIKVTTTHPVLTKAGIKSAQDLAVGDVIYDKEGKEHRMTIVKALPVTEGQYVVNVNLDLSASKEDVFTQHFVAAGGIVVGDWTMQEDRVKKALKEAEAAKGGPAQNELAAKTAPVSAAKVSTATK